MAETTQKTTESIAKGRTHEGKPTGHPTGRAGARTKRPVGPQKKAQAEAQKRRKKSIPGKRPRAGAAGPHLRAGNAAVAPQPGDPLKNGLERLTDEVDKMLDARSKTIARALAKQIEKGNASSVKVVVALAEQKKRKTEMEMNKLRNRKYLQELVSEVEYKPPAEEGGVIDKPQPGIIETLHAVAGS